ncbi:hypothetical protein Ocin01_18933 [Orchesella cincta]|uniref:Uncharacterized protein n=1 Tax=Orchesella cincta TaxID=48709 RepID=A0A1D2M447_ORCCI|nr:hypothetical protein Ocin01_18933 [Orchesella cincta]
MNHCTRFWKITSMVLGIIIVALGLFTHIDSEWRIANQRGDPCQQRLLYMYGRAAEWCPPIAIEFYFIIINIICLILSLIGFCYSNYIEKPSYVMKKVDMFHHGGAALLLLIAGILYIASALQIMSMRLHAGRREMR